jgi:hypothetical protein
MEPNNQNSYDFIMNPDQKRPAGPNFAGPQRILMILGLFSVVIVLIIIVFSLVFSSGANNQTNLISVSANQTELIRILEQGVDDVEDPKLKQKFQTLLTTTNSDAQAVTALITAREIEITSLEKKALEDPAIDEEFELALQRRDFDPVFEGAINIAATRYFQSLQAALGSAVSTQEKDTLNLALFNVQTIAE